MKIVQFWKVTSLFAMLVSSAMFQSTLSAQDEQKKAEPAPAAAATPAKTPEAKTDEPKSAPAQEASEKVPAELATVIEKLQTAIEKNDIKELEAICTPESFQQYCGQYFMIAVQLGQSERADLQELNKKYGLDKVDFAKAMEELTTEEDVAKLVKDVYVAVPADKRIEAVQEIIKALTQGDEAIGLTIGGALQGKPVSMTTEDKVTIVRVEIPRDEVQDDQLEAFGINREDVPADQPLLPPTYLKFVKSDSKWLWSGIDEEKTMEGWAKLQGDVGLPEPPALIENIEFKAKSLSGAEVDLAKLRGKVVIIDFWGTWCGPCLAELPKIKKLYEEFHQEGLEVIGVAQDPEDTLTKFFEKKPLPWENIVDGESELAQKYNVPGFPTTLLIDREGKHIFSSFGGPELEKEVRKLFEKK